MMTVGKKRLIRDLVLTGVASPIVLLLLFAVRAARFLMWIVMPILYVGQAITALIWKMFPPQSGGLFAGFGTALVVDLVLAWIVVWIVLFALVKLIQKCIHWKKREA
jgi:hypothetical protein